MKTENIYVIIKPFVAIFNEWAYLLNWFYQIWIECLDKANLWPTVCSACAQFSSIIKAARYAYNRYAYQKKVAQEIYGVDCIPTLDNLPSRNTTTFLLLYGSGFLA